MGSLFDTLTKSQIQNPGQPPSGQYLNPAEAGIALAKASARTAQPSIATIDAPQVSADPNAPAPTINLPSAPVAPQPKITTPSFADANGNGNYTSPALTTKGKILSALLDVGLGAGAGYEASHVGNPREGYNPGAGFTAGLQILPQLQAERNQAIVQQQEQQLRQAEISALPGQQASEQALKTAQASNFAAQASRREHYVIPGVGLTDEAGNVIVREPDKSDPMTTPAGRAAFLAQADPDSHILSGRDRLQFQATGTWPKTVEPGRPIYVPHVGLVGQDGTVIRAVPSAPASPTGISASQQRLLNSDPELRTLNASLKNAQAEQAKAGDGTSIRYSSPDDVQPTIDDLTDRIATRQTDLLKQGSGALSLRGTSKGAKGKPLDPATAAQYLQKAGGNKARARQLAAADGWSF